MAFIQIHWELYTLNAIRWRKRNVSRKKAANNDNDSSSTRDTVWALGERPKIAQSIATTHIYFINHEARGRERKKLFGIVNKLKRRNEQEVTKEHRNMTIFHRKLTRLNNNENNDIDNSHKENKTEKFSFGTNLIPRYIYYVSMWDLTFVTVAYSVSWLFFVLWWSVAMSGRKTKQQTMYIESENCRFLVDWKYRLSFCHHIIIIIIKQ